MATNILRRIAAVTVTTVLVGTMGLAGCGSAAGDCASLCEQFESCPGVGQGVTHAKLVAECAKLCKEEAQIADEANCTGEFDDALGCVADAPDICKSGTVCMGGTNTPTSCTGPCVQQNTALTSCLSKFCQDPKNASACKL